MAAAERCERGAFNDQPGQEGQGMFAACGRLRHKLCLAAAPYLGANETLLASICSSMPSMSATQ
jgi:hypothetical protein